MRGNISLRDVVNTRFGQGIIQSVDGNSNTYDVEIDGNIVTMNNTYVNGAISEYNSTNYEIVNKL